MRQYSAKPRSVYSKRLRFFIIFNISCTKPYQLSFLLLLVGLGKLIFLKTFGIIKLWAAGEANKDARTRLWCRLSMIWGRVVRIFLGIWKIGRASWREKG